MPAYQQILGNIAILPLRTRTRGPAATLPPLASSDTPLTIDASHDSYDPCDEVLSLFRANTFFRNFEIQGPADRLLIYGILYVSSLLAQVKPSMARREAEKALMNVALDNNFPMPGDAGFPLNQAFSAPTDRAQSEMLRGYLSQMRQELAVRLLERLFIDGETPSKVNVEKPIESARRKLILRAVVVELLKTKVHGQVIVTKRRFWCPSEPTTAPELPIAGAVTRSAISIVCATTETWTAPDLQTGFEHDKGRDEAKSVSPLHNSQTRTLLADTERHFQCAWKTDQDWRKDQDVCDQK
ncbi:MAG: hypothetical protein Q9159_005576 [Coniocarpon cinnabarinum]